MDRHGPLVSVDTLSRHLQDPDWVVFDVRHDLLDPAAGPKAYAEGHIPGAVHAHIDKDLSDPVGDGTRGRHPLPDADRLEEFLRGCGVDDDSQVVCYDDAGGMWAARLWWLLRYHGHAHVAVLDGGLTRWMDKGNPISLDPPPDRDVGGITLTEGQLPTIGLDALANGDAATVVDARAPERYTGETEPVDPVGGHIPGAINLPFAGNLRTDGRFLSPDELRGRFDLDGPVAVYCGSGVTAAHNVLAMDVAGLPLPALSPESWSGWSTQGRPVATGSD